MSLDYVKAVKVAGIGRLPIKEGSWTFQPSATQREDIEAENPEDSGYTEKNVKAVAKGTVLSDKRIILDDLNFNDKNATIYLKSGREYLMPNAFTKEPVELSKGEVSLQISSAVSKRIS